jgi:hypothetical protein
MFCFNLNIKNELTNSAITEFVNSEFLDIEKTPTDQKICGV